MSLFQTQLGQAEKPLWGVPQAFGAQSYWKRVPTPEEEAAMTMLGINHGAKGIVMWMYPTTPELTSLTSRLGRVLINRCTQWILGARFVPGLKVTGGDGVDASAWVGDGAMLVSIVNPTRKAIPTLTISVPQNLRASKIGEVFWGDSWQISAQPPQLTRVDMPALAVDMFVVSVTEGSGQLAAPALVEMS